MRQHYAKTPNMPQHWANCPLCLITAQVSYCALMLQDTCVFHLTTGHGTSMLQDTCVFHLTPRSQCLKAMKHLCVPPPQRSGHITLMGQSKHTQGQFPCCFSPCDSPLCCSQREQLPTSATLEMNAWKYSVKGKRKISISNLKFSWQLGEVTFESTYICPFAQSLHKCCWVPTMYLTWRSVWWRDNSRRLLLLV